ncbi:MAG: hypothetical protein OXC02_08535 [Rhodobacteraceae bacterium]|nr:hypothetical protein [Paracoccaceae bacterium]
MIVVLLGVILFFLLFGWLGIFVVGGLFAEFFWFIVIVSLVIIFVGVPLHMLLNKLLGIKEDNPHIYKDKQGNIHMKSKTFKSMFGDKIEAKKPKK